MPSSVFNLFGGTFQNNPYVIRSFVSSIAVFISVLGSMVRLHKPADTTYNDLLTPEVPKKKIPDFSNSVYLDEVAHNGPPHLYLHCLPSSL